MTLLTHDVHYPSNSLKNFQFKVAESMPHPAVELKRRAELYKAALHSSLYQTRVELWIQGVNDCIKVLARIEAMSQSDVLLECGTGVPTSSIIQIRIPR